MDKKTYYVITVEEDGKYFSYAETIHNSNNLVGKFPKNAITINACDTRKKADEIARSWNEIWREKDQFSYEMKLKY